MLHEKPLPIRLQKNVDNMNKFDFTTTLIVFEF